MKLRLALAFAVVSFAACGKAAEEPGKPAAVANGTWTGLMACKHESYVYASAMASGSSMARSSAENRARAALFGASAAAGPLRDSEVIDTFAEGENVHALARTIDPAIDRSALPECDAARIAWESTGECPAWTRKTSWIQGGEAHAVGVASGIKNSNLAVSTAQNRGRAELQKMKEIQIAQAGGGTSVLSTGEPVGRPVEQVECGGALYAHVVR